jgi:hypothetical protein
MTEMRNLISLAPFAGSGTNKSGLLECDVLILRGLGHFQRYAWIQGEEGRRCATSALNMVFLVPCIVRWKVSYDCD